MSQEESETYEVEAVIEERVWGEVMGRMVNELVGNHPALVCIGSANLNSSAPIKKYVRCPGITLILQYLKKKTNVDILLIDEYNTSQVCGHCHSFFGREWQIRYDRKGQRFKQFTVTHCHIRFQNAIGHTNAIVAKKGHRQIQKESRTFSNGPKPKNVRHVRSNNWAWVLPKINQTLTWNRDTNANAARNILYKGVCAVMDIPLDITLDKSRHEENQNLRPMPIRDDLISELLRAIHITPPPRQAAQNHRQNGAQVGEWNDIQKNGAPNDQRRANGQNIVVEINAQNEAQVDQKNQQNVPKNVQQNLFYMHW